VWSGCQGARCLGVFCVCSGILWHSVGVPRDPSAAVGWELCLFVGCVSGFGDPGSCDTGLVVVQACLVWGVMNRVIFVSGLGFLLRPDVSQSALGFGPCLGWWFPVVDPGPFWGVFPSHGGFVVGLGSGPMYELCVQESPIWVLIFFLIFFIFFLFSSLFFSGCVIFFILIFFLIFLIFFLIFFPQFCKHNSIFLKKRVVPKKNKKENKKK
jgi:hypothetical protein